MSKLIHCHKENAIYPKNHTQHITTLFLQNAEFLNAKENLLQNFNDNFNKYSPN